VFAFSVEHRIKSCVAYSETEKDIQKTREREQSVVFVRFGTLLEPLLPESAYCIGLEC
jgi:hypothetical protein